MVTMGAGGAGYNDLEVYLLNNYLFGAETLEVAHTKVFSVLVFSLIIHHSVKIFY